MIWSVEYGSNKSWQSRMAMAECFFLKGKSTWLAIPIMLAFVFEYWRERSSV